MCGFTAPAQRFTLATAESGIVVEFIRLLVFASQAVYVDGSHSIFQYLHIQSVSAAHCAAALSTFSAYRLDLALLHIIFMRGHLPDYLKKRKPPRLVNSDKDLLLTTGALRFVFGGSTGQ